MSLYSHDLGTATAIRGTLDFASLVAAVGAAQAVSPTAVCEYALRARDQATTPRNAMIALLSARPGWAACANLLGHAFDSGTATMLRQHPGRDCDRRLYLGVSGFVETVVVKEAAGLSSPSYPSLRLE